MQMQMWLPIEASRLGVWRDVMLRMRQYPAMRSLKKPNAAAGTMKPYPTADLTRCADCGVLQRRDHHYDCQPYEARKERRRLRLGQVAEDAKNASSHA